MSEKSPRYESNTTSLLSKQALRSRACCQAFSGHRYRPPTSIEIESVLALGGWTQNEAAELLGVSSSTKGSTTIRRWKSDPASDSFREIPYAPWRLALLEAGVVKVGNGFT